MKCFKTRESIIRDRIAYLQQCRNLRIYHEDSLPYNRAINRMYKLINPKK